MPDPLNLAFSSAAFNLALRSATLSAVVVPFSSASVNCWNILSLSEASLMSLRKGLTRRNTPSSSTLSSESATLTVVSLRTITCTFQMSYASSSLPSISRRTSPVEPIVGSSSISAIVFSRIIVNLLEFSGRNLPCGISSVMDGDSRPLLPPPSSCST